MTLSLNEVETLSKKAVRGAGYTWGYAEEGAKAVRWLCARGIDGCAALADLLVVRDGADIMTGTPVLGEVWTSRGGTLCPIATGCALSDRVEMLGAGTLQIEHVLHPVLLVPFLGLAAAHLDKTLTLRWTDVHLSTDGAALSITGLPHVDRATIAVSVTSEPVPGASQPLAGRAHPDATAKAALERFAHRTYAPATEASRLMGAGAGVSDND